MPNEADPSLPSIPNQSASIGATSTEQLAVLLYDELHVIAHRYLRRESEGHTLQTTALVHEAFLKLADQNGVKWENHAHFLGMAAHTMRRVLVDQARRRQSGKRSRVQVTLSSDVGAHGPSPAGDDTLDVIALDEALTRLEALEPRQAKLVELRFFAGLDVNETAKVLQVSAPTVKRDWRFAKAWLAHELKNV